MCVVVWVVCREGVASSLYWCVLCMCWPQVCYQYTALFRHSKVPYSLYILYVYNVYTYTHPSLTVVCAS